MTETDQLLKAVAERATAAGAPTPLPAPAFPGAVAGAEASLGFPLPPLLAGLYLRVADGGFGPGYGLRPLSAAVATYREESRPAGDDWPWPEGVLPVGDWGCAMLACVDCRRDGHPVLLFEPNADEPDHAWYEDAPSLEAWLRTWLAGTGWYEEGHGDTDLAPWTAYRTRIRAR